MKTFIATRGKGAGQRRAALRISPIAAACSTLLIATGAAYAQQQDPATLDTVTVTGIRRGIESSIATKKNSDSIVEAVSAEDIGKLPDVSIAESLARLPGLTAQRVDGRAQVISIRGLSPAYGTTLLNGREMVSTGDSRSVEYDQFPSELLSGATVYKTPDGALVGQGLSGTVDMQTVRPLNFRGRQVVLNARGESNSNGKLNSGTNSMGARLSASYIDQFANNTIGVALGYARLDSPTQEKEYKSWWWASLKKSGAPQGPVGLADDINTLNGAQAEAKSAKNVRDGLMAVLEYKPNKDFASVLDLYYSKFSQERRSTGLLLDFAEGWGGDAKRPVYTNTVVTNVNGDPVVTSGRISNVAAQVMNRFTTRDDTISAFGWNNKLKLDKWTAVADLSYSKTKRNDYDLQAWAGQGRGAFDFNLLTTPGVSQFVPVLNYADASKTLLGHPRSDEWGQHDSILAKPKVSDELKALRLSAKRDLDGIFTNIEAGVNYSERFKDVSRTQEFLELKNNREHVAVPASMLRDPTSLSFAGIPGVMSYDMVAASKSLYDVNPGFPWDLQGNVYTIKEKVTTAFSKLGIDTEVGKIPVRGNVGLQMVRTNQSSTGYVWSDKGGPGINQEVTAGKSYTDFLPSLNLTFDLGADRYVRFGAARTLARPFMNDMRAGFDNPSVNTQTRKWEGSGGNPWLEPWRANSVDISIEKYFGKSSYLSAAAFHKDLKTFVYKNGIPFDFTGFPNRTGTTPISNIGVLNAPANGHGGLVEGIELSASLEGNLLHPSLNGFGVIASATDTRSSLSGVDPNGNVVPGTPLDGLSGQTTNLTLYYEKSGFSARVSQRYRSGFEAKTRGVQLLGALEIFKVNPEKQLDLQLGYSFETGTYKGLSVLLQVNNLTDSPYATSKNVQTSVSNPGPVMPENYITYGRQILLGLTYKL